MRSYLDVRLTLPGYSFLLFVIGVNIPNLSQYLDKIGGPTTSIVMGVLTFVSGAPIGFLVSQGWYFIITKNFFGLSLYGNKNKKRRYIDFLHSEGVRKDKFVTVNVLDYLYHQCDNQYLKNYVDKRWNMYNIFGSTSVAIIVGMIFGLLFRSCSGPISIDTILLPDIIVIVSGIILIILFMLVSRRVRYEHEYMVWTILVNVVRTKGYWKELFPKSFFE